MRKHDSEKHDSEKRGSGKHRIPKRIALALLAAAVLLAGLAIPGLDNELQVVHCTVPIKGGAGMVRMALVADLHSTAYGERQQELLDALAQEAPDVVLLAGDIFDGSRSFDNTVDFLRSAGRTYLCFCVTGNHEYRKGEEGFADEMRLLKEHHIHRLSGLAAALKLNGTRVFVCGVDDPCAWQNGSGFVEHETGSYQEQVAETVSRARGGDCTVLLAHRPEQLPFYSSLPVDLVLAGHAHGGQWRVPGLLNGLYAPNQGLFPAYAGGRYSLNGTEMIVSRGLARDTIWIPRLYNPPELVIVDLVPPGLSGEMQEE